MISLCRTMRWCREATCTASVLLLSVACVVLPSAASDEDPGSPEGIRPTRPAPAAMEAGEAAAPLRLPPAQTAGGTERVSAADIRQQLQDQLVAGVARPKIDLNIEFAFNSSELTEAGMRDLDAAGETLSRWFLENRFVLAGHTDPSGSPEYNLELSKARAQSARRYLIQSFSIAPERLDAQGFGETRPLPGQPAERNRRVALEMIR